MAYNSRANQHRKQLPPHHFNWTCELTAPTCHPLGPFQSQRSRPQPQEASWGSPPPYLRARMGASSAYLFGSPMLSSQSPWDGDGPAEKMDSCLQDLPPFEDREDRGSPLLNPRLSISARFLSRAQKNCRFAAAFFPRVRPLVQAASAEHLTEESLPLSDFTKFKKPPAEIQLELKGSPEAKTSGVSEIQGLVKNFEVSLQALRLKFQESLQLYDKVSSCTDGTPEELAHVRQRLSSTFCWMKSELANRVSRDHADVATATDPSSFWPSCLQEGEAHALLKHYSDSLLNLVQKKLEEAQKTSLP